MNSFITKLFIFVILLLTNISALAYDFEINGLYYELVSLSNRTCKLTTGTTNYNGSLIIPQYVSYEGLTLSVSELDPKVFNSNITELSIPASVNVIPVNTISKCKLQKLIFCDGETDLRMEDYVKIGSSNYSSIYGQPLTYIYLGRNLTYRDNLGDNSKLTSIEIGQYVTTLPILSNSDNLEELYIPDNVKTLRKIDYCKKLKTVYVGGGVKEIPVGCFYGCTSLEVVFLGNSISEFGINAFQYCNNLKFLFLFSNNLSTNVDMSMLPKTISTIYVPDVTIYKNLLKDYTTENLLVIEDNSIEYSGKTPQLSYKNNVTGSQVKFSGLNSTVGTHNSSVLASFNFENGWITQISVPASYTITPASLTVIPDNITRPYGTNNPQLTCSFFGFKNDESTEVLTKYPQIGTTANIDSPVGTYPIIPTNAEADNYTFNYERGTLTIIKANQEIEWNQRFDNVSAGDIIELTAISSSGLPIKYSVSDESIAEIFSQGGKKYVEFLKTGTVSIRANQEGNENYNEADRVNKSVTIKSLITRIDLNKTNLNLKEGDSYQFTADIYPSDASNKLLEWTSSNTDIVTVDENGKVKAISKGEALITVKSTDGSDVSAQCLITVIRPVTDIQLDVTDLELDLNETKAVTVTLIPSDASSTLLNWSSSDSKVATVQDGIITAVGYGNAVIYVSTIEDSNIIKKINVSVNSQSAINTISSDSDNINVYASNGIIYIDKSQDSIAYVYSLQGKLINATTDSIIKNLTHGIYIIRVDNKIFKIAL